MNLIRKGRNFRLVPESELLGILKFLDGHMPESLKPNNNIYQSFSIFCPRSHLECIDLVTSENLLIDWKKPMYLPFTHKTIVDRLSKLYQNIGTIQEFLFDILILNDFNINLEAKNFPNDEAEIRSLTIDDVKLIHDQYPGKHIESIELFEALVQNLPALGVFDKKSNELASWMLCSYYGAMFSMQTLPKYRRKGYGIEIAKALTKRVIECSLVPYVAVLPHNAASKNLYLKLGFENVYQMSQVIMTPHPSVN